MTSHPIPDMRERFCKRSFNHRPHTWTDDTAALGSVDFTCPGLWGPAWSSVGKRQGLEKVMDRLVSGAPSSALFLLIRTVEAQLRIEGIGGIVLPYRPEAVAR